MNIRSFIPRKKTRRTLELFFLYALTNYTQAQIQNAGDLLVNLDFTTQTEGNLTFIANTGTLNGGFEALGGGTTVPVIKPAFGVKGLHLDGTDFLMSVVSQGGARMDAPAGVIGSQPTRSVEVWVYNDAPLEEETVLAWGKRGGAPDGSNFSCLYGWHGTWSALGQWGGPDLNYLTQPPSGTWHHITWVHTGPGDGGSVPANTTRVYVDGVPDNSEDAGVLNTHPGPFLIGSQMEGDGVTPTGGLRGSMTIGKVRIHDGVLTDANIANNFAFEKPGFPSTAPAALASGPIHRWSFNEASGTKVADSAGLQHGAIKGAGHTWTGSVVTLPGGAPTSTAAYVDLPNRLVSDRAPELGGPGEVTLEMWVTCTGSSGWARFMDFGSSAGQEVTGSGGGGEGWDYLFVSAEEGANTARTVLSLRQNDAAGNTAAGNGGPINVNPNAGYDCPVGVERHITVVWKDKYSVIVYEGTNPIREIRANDILNDAGTIKMVQLNDVNCWLGRSNWAPNDGILNGQINEFRVYDRALSAAEVAKNDADGPAGALPAPPDGDGDGLPNWFEIKYASATLNADTPGQGGLNGDGDTLTNLQEFQNGTNPLVADTDGDGLNDSGEVTAGTDPIITDTDADGLTDGAEVNTHGSNPLVADTDGDGYPDGQEIAGGSSPTNSSSIPIVFLVSRYSFGTGEGDVADGTEIVDTVSGMHAYVRGSGATWDGASLTLPGGSSETAPYVDLPNRILSRFSKDNGGRGAITIEGWVRIPTRGDAAWQRVFDFGSSAPGGNLGEIFRPSRVIGGNTAGQDYLVYTGAVGNNTGVRHLDWTNNDAVGGTGNTLVPPDFTATAGTTDALYHFATVVDETLGRVKLYENGTEVINAATALKLSNLNDVNNWIGRSNWTGDGNLQGTIDEFRIYAGSFTASDVAKSMAKGPANLPGGANPATDITTLRVTNGAGWPEWWADRTPGLPAPGSDSDGDGLTALQELGRGSDPTKADTDNDGLADGLENNSHVFVSATNTGTNPADADTDHDGLSDPQEVAALTNPMHADTDGDLALDGADLLPASPAASTFTPSHRWSFNDLPDGAIANGTPSGDLIGGSAFDAFVRGNGATANGGVVLLPGGANNNDTPYIDLPNSILTANNKVTLVTWMTIDAATNWSRVWDFGDSNNAEVPPAGIGNGTDYLFLSASRGTDGNLQRLALKDSTGGESIYEWTLSDLGMANNPGVEIFFACTLDSSQPGATVSSFYRDGTFIAQNSGLSYNLSSINDVNNWLGRSQYAGDPTLTGSFNEFRTYSGILNRNEIRRLYAGGPEGLRITSVTKTEGEFDILSITWNSKPGLSYVVEESTNLTVWSPVEVITASSDSTEKTMPMSAGTRYVRVRLQE